MRADALYEKAVRLQMDGEDEAAKSTYKRLLAKDPQNASALGNLALLICASGDFQAADKLFERATALAPGNINIVTNFAKACIDKQRFDATGAAISRLRNARSEHFADIFDLGMRLTVQQYFAAAEPWLRKAVDLAPKDLRAKFTLANCISSQPGRNDEAIALAHDILAVEPENDFTLSFLGGLHTATGKPAQGAVYLQRAAKVNPRASYLAGLGSAYANLGDITSALRCLNDAAAQEPDNLAIRSNLLFMRNYDDRASAEEIFGDYKSFGDLLQSKVGTPPLQDARPAIEGRPIRIGFCSGDFRAHACAYFLAPLFRTLDRTRFSLFAYSNLAYPDAETGRFRAQVDHWREVSSLSDAEMAQKIREDGIDILFDLSGHTTGNRLPVFALKPAPVQVSYLGFGYTTGLAAMDYFLGDETLVPQGAENLFVEKVIRLPRTMFCYEPPEAAPEVGASPAARNGYVTFGSLSRILRMNDGVLETWRVLLEQVPNSRLWLDQPLFQNDENSAHFRARLEQRGFPMERVTLAASKPHWPAYHEIDITLDCWPHNIGTTAIESLWMGVPVLSKRDRPSVGRVASVFNRVVGLADWTVDTPEAFVARGVTAASNIKGLADLRSSLRGRVQASPLMDYATFTRDVEAAMMGMVAAQKEA